MDFDTYVPRVPDEIEVRVFSSTVPPSLRRMVDQCSARVAAGEVTTRARHFRFRGNLRRMMKLPNVGEILKDQGIESVEFSPPREIYLWQKKQVKPTNHNTHRGRPSLLDMMNKESRHSVISCLWADPETPLDAVHYIAKEEEDAKNWVKQLRSKLGMDDEKKSDDEKKTTQDDDEGKHYDIKRQDSSCDVLSDEMSGDEADPWHFAAKRFREAPTVTVSIRAESEEIACTTYGST